jgi:hypothetical protein
MQGLEIREVLGLFIFGIITLALVATAVNKDSQTATIAATFGSAFANDIRAATFQQAPAGG